MVLDISGANYNNGSRLIIWPHHGGPNQRFVLDNIGQKNKNTEDYENLPLLGYEKWDNA